MPEKGNLYSILDSTKIADTVVFVVSAVSEPIVDEEAESILLAILAQGLPSTVIAAIDLENVPLKVNEKKNSSYLIHFSYLGF